MNKKICKICFKEFIVDGFSSFFYKDQIICNSCLLDFNPKFIHFKDEGINCLAIYNYDETIRKLLYQFKGCFDKELKDVFLNPFVFELRIKYFGYIIIPIPSFEGDDEERGFNHVEEIFSCLNLKIERMVTKNIKMKQSSLNKTEREKIASVMILKKKIDLSNKKVLIVDDVYTTGNSFRACLKLIQRQHPKTLKACFLAKNDKKP
ncbi:MAG: ComF family protein [Bacilli bacterium]